MKRFFETDPEAFRRSPPAERDAFRTEESFCAAVLTKEQAAQIIRQYEADVRTFDDR